MDRPRHPCALASVTAAPPVPEQERRSGRQASRGRHAVPLFHRFTLLAAAWKSQSFL